MYRYRWEPPSDPAPPVRERKGDGRERERGKRVKEIERKKEGYPLYPVEEFDIVCLFC